MQQKALVWTRGEVLNIVKHEVTALLSTANDSRPAAILEWLNKYGVPITASDIAGDIPTIISNLKSDLFGSKLKSPKPGAQSIDFDGSRNLSSGQRRSSLVWVRSLPLHPCTIADITVIATSTSSSTTSSLSKARPATPS